MIEFDNDIKDLITSAENKDNEDLKKRLETFYKSLNNKIIIQDDIPLYFRKLKQRQEARIVGGNRILKLKYVK